MWVDTSRPAGYMARAGRRRARFGSGVVGDLGLRVGCFRKVLILHARVPDPSLHVFRTVHPRTKLTEQLESNNCIQRLLLFFSRVPERSDMIEEERATSRKAHGATRSRITSG